MVSAGTLRTQDNLSIENAINCTGSMFAYCLLKKNDLEERILDQRWFVTFLRFPVYLVMLS